MVMLGTQLCDLRLVAFPLLIHSSRMKIITLCIGPCSYLGSSQLVVKTCISKHYDINAHKVHSSQDGSLRGLRETSQRKRCISKMMIHKYRGQRKPAAPPTLDCG